MGYIKRIVVALEKIATASQKEESYTGLIDDMVSKITTAQYKEKRSLLRYRYIALKKKSLEIDSSDKVTESQKDEIIVGDEMFPNDLSRLLEEYS